MAYRTEIERALDEIISEETGKKFQGIAVVHAKQKWPQLVACERNWDGGLIDSSLSGTYDSKVGVHDEDRCDLASTMEFSKGAAQDQTQCGILRTTSAQPTPITRFHVRSDEQSG
jgi:hypothetical protein